MAKTLRKKAINQILYISIGSVLGIIILFIILYNVFNSTVKKPNAKLSENNNNSEASNTEAANSQIGKSVEEVEDETIAENLSIELSDNNENKNIDNITLAENTATASEGNSNNTQDLANTANNNAEEITKSEATNNAEQEKEIKEEIPDPVFVKPIDGEIVKQYGKDKLLYSNTLKEWTTHLGIDIKANKTAVVKASSDGIVKSIKNDPRYGLTIIIEHAKGYTSVYSNLLSAEFVTIGEQVKSGQTIGTVGNSATFEIVDEPHLHFEIIKDGANVDPEMCISGL